MKDIILVGLGGLTYNGLTGLVNWIGNQAGTLGKLVLIDPDVVEERNAERQWRIGVNGSKVGVAMHCISELGLRDIEMVGYDRKFEDTIGELNQLLCEGEELIVIESVDNQMCRVAIYDWVVQMARRKEKVEYVLSGNDLEGGYAAKMSIEHCEPEESTGWGDEDVQAGLKCVGNVKLRRFDIWEEAEAERNHQVDMEAGRGCVAVIGEQSAVVNTLTAWCRLHLLESGGDGEVVWNWIDGRIVIVPRILY